MCIIAAKNKGINLPTKKTFQTMFDNNSDGAGFMYNADGVVHIRKGFMTFENFWNALNDVKEKIDVKETGMVFHFRITTQGGTNPMNCHPFPVSAREIDLQDTSIETSLGVAHNGIISLTSSYSGGYYGYVGDGYGRKDAHLSDTMIFIRDYLTNIYSLNNNFYKTDEGIDLVEKLIESKMCFLNPDGEIYITSGFVEDKGMYYSNTSYKARAVSVVKTLSGYSKVSNISKDYSYSVTKKSSNKKDKSKTSKSKTAKYRCLMPIPERVCVWGNDFYEVTEDNKTYAVDSSGHLYLTEYGKNGSDGTAILYIEGYVNMVDEDGVEIDYDVRDAKIFEIEG